MIKGVVLLLSLFTLVSSDTLYWYDKDTKINLWMEGFSAEYNSRIYSESPHMSSKQVLTGNIIIILKDDDIEVLLKDFDLVLVKKLTMEKNIYLVKTETDISLTLEVANRIYETGRVVAAYPDWSYLHNFLGK